MRWWTKVRLRARSLFRSGVVERELDRELQFHLQQQIEEDLSRGMTPAEARAAAIRDIGGVEQVKEACRDERQVRLLQDFAGDARYAVRMLRRAPVFTAVAVLTLALAIGATTAIFSVVRGVLLSPLPYPDAGRLVSLGTRTISTGRATPRLTGGDVVDLSSAANGPFDALGVYWGGELGVQVNGRGEFAGTFFVTPGFLRVFSVSPAAGRLLGDEDADRGAVVNGGFADRVLGGPRAAIGRVLNVEGQAYEVVGVTEASFEFPRGAALWLCAPHPHAGLNRTAFNYQAVARLRGEVPLARARAEVETVASRLASAFPASNRDRTFDVVPLRDRLVGQARSTLYLLMAAVMLVLAVACANIAGLLLARAATRTRELAVRSALGASRARVARQLVAESLVLASIGGAAGLAVAWVATPGLIGFAPDTLPRLHDIRVDGVVLAFALVVSVVASLAFGLAPVWHVSRMSLADAFKQGGGRGTASHASVRLRSTLVVAEIALAFVLAVGAGLLGRSLLALTRVDLGFEPDRLLVMYAHMPAHGLAQHIDVARFPERLFPALDAVPGVRSVGAVMGLPTGRYGSNGSFRVEGRHAAGAHEGLPDAGFRLASPGYFAAMHIPLVGGRDFTLADRYETDFVAVVSRRLVKQVFPGEEAIGKRIQCGLDAPGKWMTIVGVAGDVRSDSPASAPGPEIYMPLAQHPYYANEVQIVLRTDVEPQSIIDGVRGRMKQLYPEAATEFTTLPRMVTSSIAARQFLALLVASFASLALLLAMAGIYGLMAYLTTQRIPEFGVRLAMGATPARLFAQVVGQALALSAVGVAAGLAASAASSRLLAGLLFGLQPLDPSTYIGGVAVLFAVAAVSAAMPARRAARIDPVAALRQD